MKRNTQGKRTSKTGLWRISKYVFLSMILIFGLASIIITCGGGGESDLDEVWWVLGGGDSGLDVTFNPSTESMGKAWCGEAADNPEQWLMPLGIYLQLLPPLGTEPEEDAELDPDLLDFLTVSVCQVATDNTCDIIMEFTSEGGDGQSAITFEGDHFHVNWEVGEGQVGQELEIHFLVGDLDLGFASLTPKTPQSLPIKFRVHKKPFISGYIQQLQGLSASQITENLMEMYTLTDIETAWILNALGYGLKDTHLALTEPRGITDMFELEAIFECLCFPEDQYLSLTALPVISRFTPVLKFDKKYNGLPMPAGIYFKGMMSRVVNDVDGTITWSVGDNGPGSFKWVDDEWGIGWWRGWVCGKDECDYGMENNIIDFLHYGFVVPTYFKVISDKEALNQGRLRIAYWWFYGWQPPCNTELFFKDGAHHGDWEHIVVTTNPDRTAIEAVTYWFHGHWYTRHAGHFETWGGERPVAYVGKVAHGNYHNRDYQGYGTEGFPDSCCAYADWRSPNDILWGTVWHTANENLVSLSLDEEPWMLADKIGSMYEYNGKEYEILFWRWGPRLAYCNFWVPLAGCVDWEQTPGCGTHPTKEKLDWSFPSCRDLGCHGWTWDCRTNAKFDMGWPIDYSTTAQTEEIELFPAESLSQVAYRECSCMPEE